MENGVGPGYDRRMLEQQVAIVTGAGRGLGRAAAGCAIRVRDPDARPPVAAAGPRMTGARPPPIG